MGAEDGSARSDFFNVFQTRYEPLEVEYFRGSGAGGRVLYQAPDRRHLVIATRYPHGVTFRYGGSVDYMESFYVVQGQGSRKLPDGTVIAMGAGDLICVRPGLDIEYVYGPGFMDVAFFWSENAPLPASLSQGCATA